MRNGLKHFFTKYGDVYAGAEWSEIGFEDYVIVIQFSKIKEYRELKHTEKTFEKISQYGWMLRKDVIAGTIDDPNFDPPKKQHRNLSWHGEFEREVVFIFGAGASAHCVIGSDKKEFYEDTLRPPLGVELFQKRFKQYYDKYKGVKQSLIELQTDEIVDVEELFEREWASIEKQGNQSLLSRHVSIQYYLQELFSGITKNVTENYYAKNLYAKLAYKLQMNYAANPKRKFAFITFNQDALLEHFISEYFKRPIQSMDDYSIINDSPFCIYKPHGSYNWGWKFPDIKQFGASTANWLFDNNKNSFEIAFQLLGDHVTMIDWGAWGYETMLNDHQLGKHTIDKSQIQIIPDGNFNNYFPALLLPYRDKDEFTMPLNHFNEMNFYLSYARTLVIIGWKGNEAAFNKVLLMKATGIRKIIVVDPNPEPIKEKLAPFFSNPNIEKKYFKTFEEFALSDIEKELVSEKQLQH